eukprot:359108-Chlamydomonas_euryale.AAC.11
MQVSQTDNADSRSPPRSANSTCVNPPQVEASSHACKCFTHHGRPVAVDERKVDAAAPRSRCRVHAG